MVAIWRCCVYPADSAPEGRQSSIRTTSSRFLERLDLPDKERRPRLTLGSSQQTPSRSAFPGLISKVIRVVIVFYQPWKQISLREITCFCKVKNTTCNKTLRPVTEAAPSAVSALRHPGCAAAQPALHTCVCTVSIVLHLARARALTLFGKCRKALILRSIYTLFKKVFIWVLSWSSELWFCFVNHCWGCVHTADTFPPRYISVCPVHFFLSSCLAVSATWCWISRCFTAGIEMVPDTALSNQNSISCLVRRDTHCPLVLRLICAKWQSLSVVFYWRVAFTQLWLTELWRDGPWRSLRKELSWFFLTYTEGLFLPSVVLMVASIFHYSTQCFLTCILTHMGIEDSRKRGLPFLRILFPSRPAIRMHTFPVCSWLFVTWAYVVTFELLVLMSVPYIVLYLTQNLSSLAWYLSFWSSHVWFAFLFHLVFYWLI